MEWIKPVPKAVRRVAKKVYLVAGRVCERRVRKIAKGVSRAGKGSALRVSNRSSSSMVVVG